MNMDFVCKLPIPKDIKEEYPLSEKAAEIKLNRDRKIREVFEGRSRKLILVVGPCSADSEEAVMDYVERLAILQEKVSDKLILIPRIYTNKPRSTGEGYMGMLHQPDPNRGADLIKGIVASRKLHMRAINETGLSAADEMLYPENHRYLSDLLSYVAVGARSTENQQHRLTASGLNIPVGMKNPMGGDLNVMVNSIVSARHCHDFIYRGWEVHSFGNDLTHGILRGYANDKGETVPNYSYNDLASLCNICSERALVNPAVLVDTNHGNSGKDPEKQPEIAKEVLRSCRKSADINKLVKGLMIESYIEDGAQKIGEGIYGKSITDPCLGWDKTEKLIFDIADLL